MWPKRYFHLLGVSSIVSILNRVLDIPYIVQSIVAEGDLPSTDFLMSNPSVGATLGARAIAFVFGVPLLLLFMTYLLFIANLLVLMLRAQILGIFIYYAFRPNLLWVHSPSEAHV